MLHWSEVVVWSTGEEVQGHRSSKGHPGPQKLRNGWVRTAHSQRSYLMEQQPFSVWQQLLQSGSQSANFVGSALGQRWSSGILKNFVSSGRMMGSELKIELGNSVPHVQSYFPSQWQAVGCPHRYSQKAVAFLPVSYWEVKLRLGHYRTPQVLCWKTVTFSLQPGQKEKE